MAYRIDLTPLHNGERGPLCSAHFNGELIVKSSPQPEFDACRVLRARGFDGNIITYSVGCGAPRMRINIEVGADLTVEESRAGQIRIAPYKSFESSVDTAADVC